MQTRIADYIPSNSPAFSQRLFDFIGIRHFTFQEVLYHNTLEDIPVPLWFNILPTLWLLDELRSDLNEPVYIVSSYRSPEYNRKVGGKSGSLHLSFNALDCIIKNYSSKEYRLVADLLKSCDLDFFGLKIKDSSLGIGLYPNFFHIDTRGLLGRKSPSFWIEK